MKLIRLLRAPEINCEPFTSRQITEMTERLMYKGQQFTEDGDSDEEDVLVEEDTMDDSTE